MKSYRLYYSKVNPAPFWVLRSYSCTVSRRPPVLNAITGVLPMKNSC